MISSKVNPSLSNSRTLWTVIRVPAIQGLPKCILGLTAILSIIWSPHHEHRLLADIVHYLRFNRAKGCGVGGPTSEISRHRLRQVYITKRILCQARNLDWRRGQWSASLSCWAAQ